LPVKCGLTQGLRTNRRGLGESRRPRRPFRNVRIASATRTASPVRASHGDRARGRRRRRPAASTTVASDRPDVVRDVRRTSGSATLPHRGNGGPLRRRRTPTATVVAFASAARVAKTERDERENVSRSDGLHSCPSPEASVRLRETRGRPGAAAALGDPRTSRQRAEIDASAGNVPSEERDRRLRRPKARSFPLPMAARKRRRDVVVGVGTSRKPSGRRTRGSSGRPSFRTLGFTSRSLRSASDDREASSTA
jgi:hypothetical protein